MNIMPREPRSSVDSTPSTPCRIDSPNNNRAEGHQTEREKLLASLRGQTIHIPDLKPLFRDWPTATSSDLQRMRDNICGWLNGTTAPGKRLGALQSSDFGLFSSTWWPHASLSNLQILTYFSVWLFTWDDEIDLSDGSMWNTFNAAQVYRNQTLAYVRYTLGIDEECPEVTNRIILNFAPIGAALKAAYSPQQRIRMCEAMQFFMEMSGHEQKMRLTGAIPSLEEFWKYRLGCSAVPVCLAVNEFGWGSMELPPEFFIDQDVKTLYRCTNTLVSAVNDLLSIKKEIRCDAIDSLIPIIFYHVGDVQVAIMEIVAFIAAEIEHMNVAAASLVRKYDGAGEEMKNQVKNFIDGCKYYTTGNLTWSLETDRYGVDFVDGEMSMTL